MSSIHPSHKCHGATPFGGASYEAYDHRPPHPLHAPTRGSQCSLLTTICHLPSAILSSFSDPRFRNLSHTHLFLFYLFASFLLSQSSPYHN